MPLPVQIGNPIIALAFLGDLPIDLVVLCYTLSQFTATTIALTGRTVLKHFLRHPIDSTQFDFRVVGSMAYNHLNKLKDVAKYSNNTVYLNNQLYKLIFFEGEGGPVFQLIGEIGQHSIKINLYESSHLNDFPLDNLEIIFSSECPSGLVKLDRKKLEALTRLVEQKPQISPSFTKMFNSVALNASNSHDNLLKICFHVCRFYHLNERDFQTNQALKLMNFDRLVNPCPSCSGAISVTHTMGNTASGFQELASLGYLFYCGHHLCLSCLLRVVKATPTGPIKCPVTNCPQNLQHTEFVKESLKEEFVQINYGLLKNLFTSYHEFKEIELDQKESEYLQFKKWGWGT